MALDPLRIFISEKMARLLNFCITKERGTDYFILYIQNIYNKHTNIYIYIYKIYMMSDIKEYFGIYYSLYQIIFHFQYMTV